MKQLRLITLLVFFVLLFSMHATSSTDLSQDLGRHIKLGEIILSTRSIPHTNAFSYTNQDFPFINHHWLSEVFFYVATRIFGFTFLIWSKVLLITTSIGILIYCGYKKKLLSSTLISAFLFTPLFLERSTIRPELFGYFFFSCLLFIFYNYPQKRKLLYLVPVILLLWANFHISFIFGFVVMGMLVLKMSFRYIYGKRPTEEKTRIRNDLFIIFSGFVITLFNPNGLSGLLYPLNIFNNYGYTIVENQNIFFLNSLMMNPHIRYLFLLFPLIITTLIFLISKKKLVEASLLGIFFLAEIMQIRHMPFFALAAITPVSIALNFWLIKIKRSEKIVILSHVLFIIISITISLLFFRNIFFNTFDQAKQFGTAVIDDYKLSSEFILRKNLSKNIFNNFDIGGYAIYSLYPRYSVFVDNRPEAYPNTFLQETYIKIQTDPILREKVFDKYDIQTIYFAHTDQTYWAEAFIQSIANDTNWKLIYIDTSAMVLSRQKNITDIRGDDTYFKQLVEKENSYMNLIKLSRVFSIFGKPDYANLAFSKAVELNPSSCAINKNLYSQYINSPYYQKAIDIKNKIWYCY